MVVFVVVIINNIVFAAVVTISIAVSEAAAAVAYAYTVEESDGQQGDQDRHNVFKPLHVFKSLSHEK